MNCWKKKTPSEGDIDSISLEDDSNLDYMHGVFWFYYVLECFLIFFFLSRRSYETSSWRSWIGPVESAF